MGLKLRNVLAKVAVRAGLPSSRADEARRLVEQGSAALRDGRPDEALACSERLQEFDLYQAWRLKGQALARLHPRQDFTDFWKQASAEVPRSAGFIRRNVDSALAAGRTADAEAAMARLVRSGKLHAPDADYAIGLAHLHLRDGSPEGARNSISRFLGALYGRADCAAAELRLTRTLSLLFPAQQTGSPREQVLTRARAAGIPATAAEMIERTARLEQSLGQTARQCLFDTDVSREQCESFIAIVREHLAHATPFSFIRLGDGESNAIGYPASFAGRFDADAAEREGVWWGGPLSSEARAALARRIAESIHDADALGIPTVARILRDVKLDVPQDFAATRTGRGILAVLNALSQPSSFRAFETGVFTSAHLHQDIERWQLYPALLQPADEAVVVSCHPRLPDALQDRFGVKTSHHILIPPRHHSGDAFESVAIPGALPEYLDGVISQLGDWPKGRLVLVGAGYGGKIAIAEAKGRGGIALDLGSIFDYWMGVRTRSYQDIA
ncbi:MAG TPA: hypothetical protein VGM17_04200 [Rhizomicrobium sp.]|jgi:hypothetical protein